jgi:hypothetical protein
MLPMFGLQDKIYSIVFKRKYLSGTEMALVALLHRVFEEGLEYVINESV